VDAGLTRKELALESGAVADDDASGGDDAHGPGNTGCAQFIPGHGRVSSRHCEVQRCSAT
jgi:hypothetical protein